jgi:extracellular factor (EF) 3-hydroxypalmitic acid methyl ester biosynthesis protein
MPTKKRIYMKGRCLENVSDSAASTVKNALPYLTPDDLALIVGSGTVVEVPGGTTIIEEGIRHHSLLIILSGSARVLRGRSEMVAFATISRGELVGEIAFLDQGAASATVVAEQSLRILRLEESQLSSLLHANPEFASRLFQSLAYSLARRLRATTQLLPPFTVEDVPQVRRFHATRATSGGEVPEAFAEAIEDFKQSMLHAQMRLKVQESDTVTVNRIVTLACADFNKELSDHVTQAQAPDAIGAYAFRETFPFMMSSALCERLYTKPRGYAGDFETIEEIYLGKPVGASVIGRLIDGWARSSQPAQAVRYRRSKLGRDVIARLSESGARGPVAVTSLAIGPGREVFDVLESYPSAPIRFTGIDIDEAALSFCAERAEKLGISNGKLVLFQDDLVKLSLGRGRIAIPKQDFIYSMALMDYLEDEVVVRIVNWAHEQLAPGGTLAVGNFATGNPDKPFMDYIVEWLLIHRTPDQMRQLFALSKFGKSEVRVDADPTGTQLFAYCTKQ